MHRLKRLSMNASAVQPLWRNRHVDVTDRLVKKKFMLQKKAAALVVEMDVILRSWVPDVSPAMNSMKM